VKENIKIAFVIGTRAQLIKTAPLMKLLEEKKIDYRFIYTAQHNATIKKLIFDFKIKSPDYTVVNWQNEAKTIRLFIGNWLIKVIYALIFKRRKIIPFKKGIIITHGDTTTAVWGALLGKFTGNKVMHLESGLRSYNIFNPFPEELNRIITFYLTDVYVCPNQWALENLNKFSGIKLNIQNNTQYDSLKIALDNINNIELNLPKERFFVASIHRYEHIFNKKKLFKIIEILTQISTRFKCIFVLHPSTEKQLLKYDLIYKLNQKNSILFYPRLEFFKFIKLIHHAEFVLTDGGSNQEELSYMGKPTIILRQNTERIEGINKNAILSKMNMSQIEEFLNSYQNYITPCLDADDRPSEKIYSWLLTNKYIK
jgi:UDP-N-acetylglucosamine 2-epimerase (non-hydrolysing)